ncbi:hypothetical protein BOO71_0012013 [Deinococcus marmoris]|uniref:Uncharacterized protein n=1 Tax=Deinococcus marmoris TaxID=249408 RepID=A0A1U7NTW4_9DEIO|nr:hypothetical protein BOO71_0012013 [Deinococcus marmoris]
MGGRVHLHVRGQRPDIECRPEALTLALLMASVAVGAVAWRVWGK